MNRIRFSLVFILAGTLIFPTIGVTQVGSFSGFTKWFTDTTDEAGESFFGFESNCAQTVRNQTECPNFLRKSMEEVNEMKLSIDQVEEWVWIREVVTKRKLAMLRNFSRLNKISTNKDEIAGISQNMNAIGVLDRQIEKLRPKVKKAKAMLQMGGIPDGYSIKDIKKAAADTQREEAELQQLLAARDEILIQEPLLGHDKFQDLISKVKEDADLSVETPGLKEALAAAIKDTQTKISDKTIEYDQILKNGREVKEILKDQDLLQELLAAEEAQMGSTPQEKIALNNARCRLEQRMIKHQAIGVWRQFALDSALVIGGAVAMPVKAARSATNSVKSLKNLRAMLPGGGMSAAEGAMDFSSLETAENECKKNESALLANESKSDQNGSLAKQLADCRRGLSNQRLLMALGHAPGPLGKVKNLIKSRLARTGDNVIAKGLNGTKDILDDVDTDDALEKAFNNIQKAPVQMPKDAAETIRSAAAKNKVTITAINGKDRNTGEEFLMITQIHKSKDAPEDLNALKTVVSDQLPSGYKVMSDNVVGPGLAKSWEKQFKNIAVFGIRAETPSSIYLPNIGFKGSATELKELINRGKVRISDLVDPSPECRVKKCGFLGGITGIEGLTGNVQ